MRLHWLPVFVVPFCVLAQTSQSVFDVASVKVSAAPDGFSETKGGPGTDSPGQFAGTNLPLRYFIAKAWGLVGRSYRLSGPPSLDSGHYDIIAKIPAGATNAEFELMLQHLLQERLGLTTHHEDRAIPVYELVVAGGGPKIREGKPPAGEIPVNVNGLNGKIRIQARGQNIDSLARLFQRWVDRPIINQTTLAGTYDCSLEFEPDDRAINPPIRFTHDQSDEARTPALNIFEALVRQLGLRLEPRSGPVDVLVVDRFNNVPVPN
jgi:uncharacterized protein (TIGR03435 family)